MGLFGKHEVSRSFLNSLFQSITSKDTVFFLSYPFEVRHPEKKTFILIP